MVTTLQIAKTRRNIQMYIQTRSVQQVMAIKIDNTNVTWLCRQMADVLYCTTAVRMSNPLASTTSRNKLPDSQSQALCMKSAGKLSYAFSVPKCPSDVGTYLITGISESVGRTVSSKGICGYPCCTGCHFVP